MSFYSSDSSDSERCDCKRRKKRCQKVDKKKDDDLQLRFEVPLVPEQEVPPLTDLDTTGKLLLQFDKKFRFATYKLFVCNGEGITQGHLHANRAGQVGPIVVWLYPSTSPPAGPGEDINGLAAKGTILNENLTGAENIGTIAALYDAIRRGFIYVNVHSLAHPGGVVRGQVFANDTTGGQ